MIKIPIVFAFSNEYALPGWISIASLLNMSPRNMHGKLEQRDTSYQEILDDLRSQLAIQYIEQDSMSISQITYQLGFTDTSNFSRAFRRWTGHSPSEYRKAKAEN